jgi:hypothetical protein
MTKEEDDIADDPLEELFGHLPDRVMIDLNSKAESLLKKLTPEKLTHSLRPRHCYPHRLDSTSRLDFSISTERLAHNDVTIQNSQSYPAPDTS